MSKQIYSNFEISVKYWNESGKNVFKRLQKAGVKNKKKIFLNVDFCMSKFWEKIFVE